MTPNEGRAVMNRPQSDEPRADELWMPWNNLQPMGEAASRRTGQQRRQQAAAAGAGANAEDGDAEDADTEHETEEEEAIA
jgi:hypothetical protein